MQYCDLLNKYPEDEQHLRALISARGVDLSDEVDEAFMDVLDEEGYEEVA